MIATISKRGLRANLLIRDARVVDPAQGIDTRADVLIEKGQIAAIEPAGKGKAEGLEMVEAGGSLLLPGFVDLHAHLRTPGREDEEDIASGTRAAAAGGYVAVCAMPNTDPVVDNAAVLQSLVEASESEAAVRVAFLGSISRAQEGVHLSDMWDLAHAGAVAFSDDGRPVSDGGLLLSAFEAARLVGLPLSLHCEDTDIAGGGVMNEGEVSARLGLAGIPAAAETASVAAALETAAYAAGRVHIAHVSCGRSAQLIESARRAGAQVTCEVTPHHLALTESKIEAGLDSSFKMNPPLRTEADRQALVAALAAGTIDCVATDHAPHASQEKEVPFEEAPFGVIGLETAFPVLYSRLVDTGELALETLIMAMSTNPARAFALPVPALAAGAEANLTLVDTEEEFDIVPDDFKSKSRNTAFAGWRVKGRVLLTLAAGRLAYRRP